MKVLEKGLNFSANNRTSIATTVIQQVERAIWKRKIEDQEADTIRTKITGVLLKPPHLTPNITPTERQALKNLQEDESIVSFYSSPTYQLSKHLSIILSPLVGKTTSFVKNSAEFARFIRQHTIQKGEVMVSFDVVSLFTKIPVDFQFLLHTAV